jgi:hypothetical protein
LREAIFHYIDGGGQDEKTCAPGQVNMFYKKQLIAPWAQSLVPETCRCTAVFASLVVDSVRRAKADFPLVPLCPVKSMTPVLAIGGKGS